MPPKPKLYKSTGKMQLKNGPQDSFQNNAVSLAPEQEQQFQIELYWCIQQLQTALSSGKLNNKQGLYILPIFCCVYDNLLIYL